MIRNASIKDAANICNIYNHYIANTIITFEEEPVAVSEMEKRISAIIPSLPWIVYEEKGRVIGYAYACKWKERSAYRLSVETAIYLDKDAVGKGIGKMLYQHLLNELKKLSIHAVIGGISLPNETSQRLHEKMGFKKVSHFAEVGFKFDKWIDVGYWEKIL